MGTERIPGHCGVPPSAKSTIAVLPMGEVGAIELKIVAAHFQGLLSLKVDLIRGLPLPGKAYMPDRHQYDAGILIRHLSATVPEKYARLLAVTSVDLASPILTHLYGEAEVGGRAALVSTHRLRQGEHGVPVPMDLYYERLAKVSLHELCHTFDLYHCTDPACLMRFSSSLRHLDHLRLSFCETCSYALKRGLQMMQPSGEAGSHLPSTARS